MQEVPGFPDPAANAVLSTECLVDKSLIVERVLHPFLFRARVDLNLDLLESLVHVNQIGFLIKQNAEVFDCGAQQQLLGDCIKLAFDVVAQLLEVTSLGLIHALVLKPFDDLFGGLELDVTYSLLNRSFEDVQIQLLLGESADLL